MDPCKTQCMIKCTRHRYTNSKCIICHTGNLTNTINFTKRSLIHFWTFLLKILSSIWEFFYIELTMKIKPKENWGMSSIRCHWMLLWNIIIKNPNGPRCFRIIIVHLADCSKSMTCSLKEGEFTTINASFRQHL